MELNLAPLPPPPNYFSSNLDELEINHGEHWGYAHYPNPLVVLPQYITGEANGDGTVYDLYMIIPQA